MQTTETKDTHGKMVANMDGNVYRKRAAVKLVFTTVYSSSAAPSFAVRQNLLAALLMRKQRKNQFYNRLRFYLCSQLCLRQTCINHLAKIGRKSRFVGRMGSGKISFTAFILLLLPSSFPCGKLARISFTSFAVRQNLGRTYDP